MIMEYIFCQDARLLLFNISARKRKDIDIIIKSLFPTGKRSEIAIPVRNNNVWRKMGTEWFIFFIPDIKGINIVKNINTSDRSCS